MRVVSSIAPGRSRSRSVMETVCSHVAPAAAAQACAGCSHVCQPCCRLFGLSLHASSSHSSRCPAGHHTAASLAAPRGPANVLGALVMRSTPFVVAQERQTSPDRRFSTGGGMQSTPLAVAQAPCEWPSSSSRRKGKVMQRDGSTPSGRWTALAGKVLAAQQQLKCVGPQWQAKCLQHNSSSSVWDRTGRQSVCSTTAAQARGTALAGKVFAVQQHSSVWTALVRKVWPAAREHCKPRAHGAGGHVSAGGKCHGR